MQVNLSWAAVTGALYYKIYRGNSTGGPYILIGQSNPSPMLSGQSTSPAVTTYQDGPGNLPNGLDFYYVVSTVTADGESSYSAEYHAGPPTQPSSPIGLTGLVL